MELINENDTLSFLKDLITKINADSFVVFDKKDFKDSHYYICKNGKKWSLCYMERGSYSQEDFSSLEELCYSLANIFDVERHKIFMEGIENYFFINKTLKMRSDRIKTLRDEVSLLEEKKNELQELEANYYKDYFSVPREDYAHLTDLPTFETQNHVLRYYSRLNIEEVGKMICELLKKYENQRYVTERSFGRDYYNTGFGSYLRTYPILLIKKPSVKYDSNHSFDGSMAILYPQMGEKKDIPGRDIFSSMKEKCKFEYPNSQPVVIPNSLYPSIRCSKLKYMINFFGDVNIYDGDSIKFESCCHDVRLMDLSKHEYIKELIYSLAYYQKQHGIERMGAEKTREVYKRIFKIEN